MVNIRFLTLQSSKFSMHLEKFYRAKEQEKKIQARMKYLAEFNERQRKERASKAHEKQNRIRQRVQTAAEMELRRKITMIRQWRSNERKRLNRLKQDREAKQKRKEEDVSLRTIYLRASLFRYGQHRRNINGITPRINYELVLQLK